MFLPALYPRPMELEELVFRPAPLHSTGSACSQGRLLPRASRGTVCCVGVCLGLRVRVRQRWLRRFFCCFRLLPGPLPVDTRLLPPPPGYPCARPSYCLLTQIQNWPRRNNLRDCVLPPEDGGPNPNHPRLLHRPSQ